MDIFASYATDEKKELEGSWQSLGDAEFLVARANNRNYVRALSAAIEKNQALLDKQDKAADKLSDGIMASVFADTILLDWKKVKYRGKDFAYSKENARIALSHKDFRREIATLAENINAYRAKLEDEQVKN